MEIAKTVRVGSTEQSDILITVCPNPSGGIQLELETKRVIAKLFGEQLEQLIKTTVEQLGVRDIIIKAKDNGALDYTIRARIKAAVEQAV